MTAPCSKSSIFSILLLTACSTPAIKFFDSEKHPPKGDMEEPDSEDTGSGTQETGHSEDSDSGEGEGEETGDSSEPSECEGCTGIISISPGSVVLKSNGIPLDEPETVDVFGWTTGLQMVCADSLEHLTWEFGTTDTSTSGYTTLSLNVKAGFSGNESGVCSLSSDYGEATTLVVELNQCPECEGITSCSPDELLINTSSATASSTSTTCTGRATGIEVTCEGDPDYSATLHFGFYSILSTVDSSTSGSFTLTVGVTDGWRSDEYGICTLTTDQGGSVVLCFEEMDTGIATRC